MKSAGWHLLLVGILCGCTFKGPAAEEPAGAVAEASGYWQSQPTAMRIYPTTRFVKQGGDVVLEARIELFDEMGDAVKGSGEFRFELRAGTNEQVLYSWRVELRGLEDQRTHYDPITRGYLFRLKMDDAAAAKRSTRLTVYYTHPSGRRHDAASAIRTDW